DGHGLTVESLRSRGFEGKVGETARFDDVVAVGVGDLAAVTPSVVRRASGSLAKAAASAPSVANRLLDAVAEADRPAAARAAAEGSLLGPYRFTRYKRNGDERALAEVVVVAKGGKRVGAAAEVGASVAAGVTLARDLVNTPAGDLNPIDFAAVAEDVAARVGLGLDVIDEDRAAELALGGLLGVSRGSDNPPRLVILRYQPPSPRGSMAWVGKGITFDSGGLSLKSGEGMMTMKCDMAGAAAVLGAMSVLPALAPRVAVTAYLCLAENMPSGRAIRPGDVLTARNGTTIEVLNTDAEGRLVLADGLSLAAEAEPDAMVDLATLTGAAKAALGPRIAALFGNHDGFVDQVRAAADRAGESLWPLPLPQEYRKLLDSQVADLRNISGGGSPGALTAGLFLQEFVAGRPWAHLDIAGPAWVDDDDALGPRGGTGYGVRTLLALAETFRKPT
ncbi:MAG: leucyl aminopeptidase, partial [Acidimicrobiia bacterium]